MHAAAIALPPALREGDRLDSSEFLLRWEAMPLLKHAELIDGVVFMPSPVFNPHANIHYEMIGWTHYYKDATPGCHGGSDETWKMGPKDVPQPDIALYILSEFGGQSRLEGQLSVGAPELIVEVTGSSYSRDLGIKLELYRTAGVREYLTVLLQPQKVVWRQLARGRCPWRQEMASAFLRSRPERSPRT